MKDKLLIIWDGKAPEDIKKLLLKLFCADMENSEIPESYDEDLLLCGSAEDAKRLESLGYKTVTFAYSDKKINEKNGNADLERGGYKFEDGV